MKYEETEDGKLREGKWHRGLKYRRVSESGKEGQMEGTWKSQDQAPSTCLAVWKYGQVSGLGN